MILSVSRRTDIPAFYSDWFMNRIRAGFVYVRNPFNLNQISRIELNSEITDCIVFWSKNPVPIIRHLNELDERKYKYYFQFTITPYSDDLEAAVENKDKIIDTFIKLSQKIGKEKVILRYDPIILTDKYNYDFHFAAFENILSRLHNYTEKAVISFMDSYKKTDRNMKGINLINIKPEDMYKIAAVFSHIAEKYNMAVETCAEAIDLSAYGIGHGKCIDGDLIEKIIGYKIKNKDRKDGNREHCGCMKCIDIGEYDTCIHGCLYCYANTNKNETCRNYKLHDTNSPILTGNYDENLVKVRDLESFRVFEDNEQLSFLDW